MIYLTKIGIRFLILAQMSACNCGLTVLERSMRIKTKELIEVLTKLAFLLKEDDERHWSAWLLRAQGHLENADYSGIDYLLGAYGGMGSFNDFIAGQTAISGKFDWKPGYAELNDEIDALRGKAWSLATAIKRNYKIQSDWHMALLVVSG